MEADYILNYEAIPEDREHTFYLMARIKAGPVPAADIPPPLDLSIVLDRSGSMAGGKLESVKRATELVLQYLGERDRLSLVSYNQEVTVDVLPGSVTQTRKQAITKAVKALQADGYTNLSGGWLQGCRLVVESEPGLVSRVWQRISGQTETSDHTVDSPQRIKRVLLLTDGLANRGVTDQTRLAAMARQKRAGDISTTAVGVGFGFDEDLLTGMAAEGGGNFYFADDVADPDQMAHIFSQELKGLLQVVGQNLVITLILSAEVGEMRQLNSYPVADQEGTFVFRLGDLHADETKSLLVEISTKGLKRSGEIEVGWLRFEYDELGEEAVSHQIQEFPITLKIVSAEAFADQKLNVVVLKAALLLSAAQARQRAVRQADQGDFAGAKQILADMADDIQAAGLEANLEDDELQTEHDRLREEAIDMELGQQRYNAHTRKATMTTSSLTGTAQFGSHEELFKLHARLKQSRSAVERQGETPTSMTYQRQSVDLTMDLLRIGRAAQNYIVIPENGVSKYHCQIMREGDDLILVDLKSTNGTFANGGRVQGRFRLSVGDVVTVGPWSFIFH